MVRRVFLGVFGLLLCGGPGAAIELDFGIIKTLEQLALPIPDPDRPIVCHGFGCAYRTPIVLRPADRAQLRKLFGTVAARSPEAERKAMAAAMAWFEKRVAGEAGTARARAPPGAGRRGGRRARRLRACRRSVSIRLLRQDQQHHRIARNRRADGSAEASRHR